MFLAKKLSSDDVCKILAQEALKSLPEDIEGEIQVIFDEDGDVEIYVNTDSVTKKNSQSLN